MKALVTGAAGFIGQKICKSLLNDGHKVLAIDSINPYYSTDLKRVRISELLESNQSNTFSFIEADICEDRAVKEVELFKPETIFHFAAQPGVRLGLGGLRQYSHDNIEAFLTVLNLAINLDVEKFLYASSSSVYGRQSTVPFSELEEKLFPASIYGVTKLANELFISTVTESKVKCRGLRFFSVYGPNGRPDMAYFRAIGAALLDLPFYKNGSGEVARDFTFISDVSESVLDLERELGNRPAGSKDIVNIGGGSPVKINELLSIIEEVTGKSINVLPKDSVKEDLNITEANYDYLENLTGKDKFVEIQNGIEQTVRWFLNHPIGKIEKWIDQS
jgi:UDP-glucuronate 4-epimerase